MPHESQGGQAGTLQTFLEHQREDSDQGLSPEKALSPVVARGQWEQKMPGRWQGEGMVKEAVREVCLEEVLEQRLRQAVCVWGISQAREKQCQS